MKTFLKYAALVLALVWAGWITYTVYMHSTYIQQLDYVLVEVIKWAQNLQIVLSQKQV